MTLGPAVTNEPVEKIEPVKLRNQINSEFPDRFLAGLGLPTGKPLIHVKNREMLQLVMQSYSGSSIADAGKVVRPFNTGTMKFPGKWVSVSGFYSIANQRDCYRLLAKSEFEQQYPDLIPLPYNCLLYTSPSPRDQRGSRMPSSA